ncbi:DsbA family protein [Pseudonocardia zijingensis]|jgi:protein-disulfide isomerase|uniref:Thioredoxin-like fold domain-containing protein n=1 Tax=Pseudonocardia zijingensis TaxID=153376 RepID=A0ABP3YM05_9PSEU
MSGASRSEKRRKQEAAEQRLAAAGIQVPQKRNRTPTIVVTVVLVLAVVIGAAVLLARGLGGSVEPTWTASAEGAVVTAGTGPVVIDVYEDYLCPSCERFEERYGDEITTALNEGRITVRFHTIAILDTLSNPEGYSTRAANAALCAVPAGIFPKYHKKLFDEQPAEGSAGLSDEELIAFGTELGAQGDFAACVQGGTNTDAVAAETDKATSDPALQTNGRFGTPTVAIDGKKIDLNDTSWLQNAIG